MGQLVYVARYEFLHSTEVRVFTTAVGAESWRQHIAQEFWQNEIDTPMPEGEPPDVIADIYFARVAGHEFFDVTETNIEEEEAVMPRKKTVTIHGFWVIMSSSAGQLDRAFAKTGEEAALALVNMVSQCGELEDGDRFHIEAGEMDVPATEPEYEREPADKEAYAADHD